jgi:hypothetical protein
LADQGDPHAQFQNGLPFTTVLEPITRHEVIPRPLECDISFKNGWSHSQNTSVRHPSRR